MCVPWQSVMSPIRPEKKNLFIPCRTAWAMMGGWQGLMQLVQCVPIWYPRWLEMTAGVVGPNQGQLPPTSPLALFSNGEREREREREPGICMFFHTIHLSVSSKTMTFQGGLHFFWVSAYLIIVFITSMNIVHSLSKHSHVQSESAHEIKLYLSHKLAVVGTQFF